MADKRGSQFRCNKKTAGDETQHAASARSLKTSKCTAESTWDSNIQMRLRRGHVEQFEADENVFRSKTNEMLTKVLNGDPSIGFELILMLQVANEEIQWRKALWRHFQCVSECGLQKLLYHISEQNGPQRLVSFGAPLLLLEGCCSSSAVVKRVMAYPGIVELILGIIETNIRKIWQFRKGMSDADCLTCMLLTCALFLVGKFMSFPKDLKRLHAWWNKHLSPLINDAVKFSQAPSTPEGFRAWCDSLLLINDVKFGMENDAIREPYEAIRNLNRTGFYGVFCSSLKCSVLVDRDGLLPHCGRCMLARYCSRQCQRDHWKQGHKWQCWKRDPWWGPGYICGLFY